MPFYSYFIVFHSLGLVTTAAKVESQNQILVAAGVPAALEYACLHYGKFKFIAGEAAGAAVALQGRYEGGKALSQRLLFVVLDQFVEFFDPEALPSTKVR